jgi:heptosyltransferase I
MKALLVKMSSLGDVVHALPAVSDLRRARPDVDLHWLVERSYADIVAWHGGVARVWPVDQRRWLRRRQRADWQAFRTARREWRDQRFDCVVDAQGLIKSAIIARLAGGRHSHGFAADSSRESLAGWFIGHGHRVDVTLPAVQRIRQLFADIFHYSPSGPPDFGIRQSFASVPVDEQALVLLPGGSWASKQWPLEHWQRLAGLALAAGWRVSVVWGTEQERQLAQNLLSRLPQTRVASQRESIPEVAAKLAGAGVVVGLDSGFSHLAAALERPVIGLFGATSPVDYALAGERARNLSAGLNCAPCHRRDCPRLQAGNPYPPCMAAVTVDAVWQQIQTLCQR